MNILITILLVVAGIIAANIKIKRNKNNTL